MGRGIGRLLFQHAIERSGALEFRELEIESDPNAEGLFKTRRAPRLNKRPRRWAGAARVPSVYP